MSEYPDWLEDYLPDGLSYDDAQELHRALRTLSRYVPNLEDRLRLRPNPRWSFWRRYLWYARNG